MVGGLIVGAGNPVAAGVPSERELSPPAEAAPAAPDRPPQTRLARTGELVLPTGRPETEAKPDRLSAALHGEVEIRYRAARDLPLEPPLSDPNADTLGQSHYLYDWIRLRPQLHYRRQLSLVAQLDLTRGIAMGDTARWTAAARDPMDELQWSLPGAGASFRHLYLQYSTPIGRVRVGQQGSHWGMGLLANDGDHPRLFGDLRRGSLVERVLLSTKPLGDDEPLRIAVAGDLVFEDRYADLVAGDRATQIVGVASWEGDRARIGLYGGYRHQRSDDESPSGLAPFAEWMKVGMASLSGAFATPAPTDGITLFGELEGVFVGGATNRVRTIDPLRAGDSEAIAAFGGALTLGAVGEAQTSQETWGELVVAVELGYASGDADPGDGVTRRFTFDENHNVGLVLFDHLLAFKTARAATIAADPATVHRGAPGLALLPSEGGVFGAAYVNPTLVVRPEPWLDLKGGLLWAQATADVVDPYRYGALGDYANYDGGDEARHDLGLEIDLGIDARLAARRDLVFRLGAEGGLLLPGGGFDDELGQPLPPQYLLNTKLGLTF